MGVFETVLYFSLILTPKSGFQLKKSESGFLRFLSFIIISFSAIEQFTVTDRVFCVLMLLLLLFIWGLFASCQLSTVQVVSLTRCLRKGVNFVHLLTEGVVCTAVTWQGQRFLQVRCLYVAVTFLNL